jgi:hypothetical protein
MNEPLSPSAQVVLDATFSWYDCEGLYSFSGEQHAGMIAAAALRAAADQVVPLRRKPLYADSGEESAWSAQQDTRDELLAIAYELEAQQ